MEEGRRHRPYGSKILGLHLNPIKGTVAPRQKKALKQIKQHVTDALSILHKISQYHFELHENSEKFIELGRNFRLENGNA